MIGTILLSFFASIVVGAAMLLAGFSGWSLMVALACIAWFMGWVKKRGFVPFAIYRIIAGIVVLAWAYKSTHTAL